MTLRSKYKKRKLNNEQAESEAIQGASYIRYEIIEKRGQQVLLPVRYSIRTNPNIIGIANNDDQHQLERKIMNNELDFEYKPSNLENLFAMDEKTQEIQKILQERFQTELEEEDIMEVMDDPRPDLNTSYHEDFSFVKIKPECRDKYGGHEHVAAALKRLSKSPRKREGQMRDIMEHLMQSKQMKEILVTNASENAIKFIKKK